MTFRIPYNLGLPHAAAKTLRMSFHSLQMLQGKLCRSELPWTQMYNYTINVD